MGVSLLRVVLSFGLVLLVLSLLALFLVHPDSPSFVPALLAVVANIITVAGSWLILRVLLARESD